ncbi:hypothetical protein [Paenibacillus monticola]|uniref:DUF4179 domain-containing protein n=1 Tax=Paenibacillus monticola TaxID=2666075 RepID=A0A7X2H2X8_9BACL|nr:hypothetical protein [Paenibacillus monticola]MRN52526.1 hypothetical protein [Paenibacillus monticola]
MVEPDVNPLKEHLQYISVEAEKVLDVQLDTAIRRGIEQGQRRRISQHRGSVVMLLAALAVALFIIVPWAYQNAKPERAQLPPKSWGELELFRPIVENNMTLKSALDMGLVTQVKSSSPEVKGFQWTINGVLTDRRGMFVLYTVQNNTQQKKHIQALHFTDTPEINKNGGYGASGSYSEEDGSPGVTLRYAQITWNDYLEKLPKELAMTLTLVPDSGTATATATSVNNTIELNTVIKLDQVDSYFEGQIVELQKSMSIAGQKININKAYIGPTGIYVEGDYDGRNTMKIFDVIKPRLLLGKGKDQSEVYSFAGPSMNGAITNVYHNDNRQPDAPIRLIIDGIAALDKSKQEFVIDTEKLELIKAPDERLSISPQMSVAVPGELILTYFQPREDTGESAHNAVVIYNNFTDGEGSGHFMDSSKGTTSYLAATREQANGTSIDYYFKYPTESLPQPLTFKLEGHPKDVLEAGSLQIR